MLLDSSTRNHSKRQNLVGVNRRNGRDQRALVSSLSRLSRVRVHCRWEIVFDRVEKHVRWSLLTEVLPYLIVDNMLEHSVAVSHYRLFEQEDWTDTYILKSCSCLEARLDV